MRRTSMAIAVAGVVLSSGPARAEQPTILEPPRERQGYYVSLGLGGLVTQNWDEGDAQGVWPGSTFGLRLGQLLTPRFGMGLFLDLGGAGKGKRSAGLVGFGLETQLQLAGNLAARGGFGLGVVSLADDADPDDELRGSYGASYFLGLSYDWVFTSRSTGGWALTPFVQARAIPGDPIVSVVGMFGVEITWWSGLPRHQLQLPEADAYERAGR